MTKLFSLAAGTFLATAAVLMSGSGDKDAIMKEEKAVWETVKIKDNDAFKKYLADDFRGVYKEGISHLEKEIADIKKADLKAYSFGDMDVVFLGKDAAMVTYKVAVQATQEGKDVSGSYNCSSVWKKSGNDWRVVQHSEVKAE